MPTSVECICCREVSAVVAKIDELVDTSVISITQHPLCADSNMPAGNSQILFSGALPSQILRVLKVFGCASINNHTFFDHGRYFLHPSIASIWKEHQANYLKELRKEKRGLILGGDDSRKMEKKSDNNSSHISPPHLTSE